MAGAKTGWVEAGYVDTPAPLSAVLKQAARVPGEARDIRILPGIAQRDTKAPDVMRGEETQIARRTRPAMPQARRWSACPARIRNGCA